MSRISGTELNQTLETTGKEIVRLGLAVVMGWVTSLDRRSARGSLFRAGRDRINQNILSDGQIGIWPATMVCGPEGVL